MKPVKKVRPNMTEQHPPSRAWLVHQNDLALWKSLNGLNGTSTGSEVLDAKLRKKFGGYSGDPTARQHRSTSGAPIVADESAPATPVEMDDVDPE